MTRSPAQWLARGVLHHQLLQLSAVSLPGPHRSEWIDQSAVIALLTVKRADTSGTRRATVVEPALAGELPRANVQTLRGGVACGLEAEVGVEARE
jgi:hypothetical protein